MALDTIYQIAYDTYLRVLRNPLLLYVIISLENASFQDFMHSSGFFTLL